MIRLRFVRHPGIFSTLVEYAQFGFPQTHCEAILPDDMAPKYLSAPGAVIGSWFHGGVQIKPIGYDDREFSHELFLNIPATQREIVDFYTFFKSQIGQPYDALAIVSFAAGRDWQCPDSWFCSEIVAAALERSLPKFGIVPTNKVTVKDLAVSAHSYAVVAAKRSAEC